VPQHVIAQADELKMAMAAGAKKLMIPADRARKEDTRDG
jgi:hypothetical protein